MINFHWKLKVFTLLSKGVLADKQCWLDVMCIFEGFWRRLACYAKKTYFAHVTKLHKHIANKGMIFPFQFRRIRSSSGIYSFMTRAMLWSWTDAVMMDGILYNFRRIRADRIRKLYFRKLNDFSTVTLIPDCAASSAFPLESGGRVVASWATIVKGNWSERGNVK